MSRLRILCVLSRGEYGGAELAALAALRHRPDDVEFRVVLLSPGPIERDLGRLGVPLGVIPGFATNSRGRIRLVAALAREIVAFRPNVIYATGNKAALASVPSSKRNRVPLVWHKCDTWYDRRGATLLARQCRMVIAPTWFCGAVVPRSRLRVIEPPLPMHTDFRVASDRPTATIGSVGRLEPRKGHQYVVAATGALGAAIPELRLLIAGAAVPYAACYQEKLLGLAQAHGIAARVELLGHVSKIEDVFSRLTLLVNASYRDRWGRGGEAFGLAIAEASWAGLPVVVTAGSGASEHVVHGVNGLVVPQRDSEALASAVYQLVHDPARAAELGEQGASLARERFDPETASRRLFAALRSCA